MKIEGREIPETIISGCLARMHCGESFTGWEIAWHARAVAKLDAEHNLSPIVWFNSDSLSYRLIQRERKAGRIRQIRRGVWITVVDGGK